MHASLRTLLAGIIDYAGLFPPAKLAMPDAIRRYRDHLGSPHAWIMGRMIVPVRGLDDFDAGSNGMLPARQADEPWRLSATVSPASDLAALDADLERVETFNARHEAAARGLCIIDAIELRAESATEIDDALDLIPEEYAAFIEIPIHHDPRGTIAALAGTAAAAKVRTGGPSVEYVPTPAELARFIRSCALAEVAFKATAGLHHPFRHDSTTIAGAKEFGFLNVFVGAALARAERIDDRGLADLLADESPKNFSFEHADIAWRSRTVSLEEIASTREEFALCFGSCSVDEPIADLRSLGMIPLI